MRRKKVIFVVSFLLLIPLLVWSAERTFTTYTWDSDIDVQPEQTLDCLNIEDNSFACKRNQGNQRVYVKVYLTDEFGAPVTSGATITYVVTGGGGASGTLQNVGSGYYGGTNTSDCALYGNIAEPNARETLRAVGSHTVTVTATRGTCTITKSMIVP